jgi:ABC-2 type transport system ATP-binding protein
MKRKVALLQVLVPQAPLLILDEPTNTLDPTMRDELLQQLRQVRAQGQAVLFSSHVLSEVEQICDRVGILQRGRLVHVQRMAELREARLIRARFVRIEKSKAGPGLDLTPPPLPGLQVRDWQLDQLTVEYAGPLPPLLHWLAGQPLLDLEIKPLGLSNIYSRYHGVEA